MKNPEIINHPYLTAIKRTDLSVPTRYLLKNDLLKGKILDFGCGFGYDTDELKKRGFDIFDFGILASKRICHIQKAVFENHRFA